MLVFMNYVNPKYIYSFEVMKRDKNCWKTNLLNKHINICLLTYDGVKYSCVGSGLIFLCLIKVAKIALVSW